MQTQARRIHAVCQDVDERDKPRGSEQPGLAGQLAAGRVMTDDPGDRTKK